MPDFDLRCGSRSNSGRQRENNEDRVVCNSDRGIFLVLDGVGGEVGGEKAAKIAEEHLLERLRRPTGTTEQVIEQAIVLANREILTQATENPALRGMSCVLTAVVLEPRNRGIEAVYGHVGDTRLYRLFPGGIEKLTSDHSFVGELEERGELTEAEAMRHPRRNEIFRDVGSSHHELGEGDFVDIRRFEWRSNEALLLCSDGLSDQVGSQQIRAIVEHFADDPQQAVDQLVAVANEAGGKDNVSVILVVGPEYGSPEGMAKRSRRADDSAPASSEPVAPGPSSFPRPEKVQVHGAAAARTSWKPLEWIWNRLHRGWRWWLLVPLASLALLWAWPRLLGPWIETNLTSLQTAAQHQTLEVGPSSPHKTITAALAAAQPGDRVVVRAGRYAENLRIKDQVALVSAEPRGAVLVPRTGAYAVLADRVRGASLEGFRIDLSQVVEVGLRLVDSELVVRGIEVSGATDAAIRVSGLDRSTIESCFLHDNSGAAVAFGSGSQTVLRDCVANENSKGNSGRFAIEIHSAAWPRLHGNSFADNGAPVICRIAGGNPTELFLANRFEGLAQTQAVLLGAPSCGPAAP